eukprot:jgi/Galph1/1626/GphlegSOOS_G303.1
MAESFFTGKQLLSPGIGYFILIGLGGLLAILTTVAIWLERSLRHQRFSSEEFNTAGRSLKPGMVGAVIISRCTWAATLLQSSNVAYNYGISGPFWYAAGATIQIILFSILALEMKLKAPKCHSYLEVIRVRWGKYAHWTFLLFAYLASLIVVASLILGGAAIVHTLTGIPTDLISFLIPIGVIVFTLAGGLKATFLSDYFHTVVIYVGLCIFAIVVYTGASSSPLLGSPSKVYQQLTEAATLHPVSGNRDGSYLTMFSKDGLIFGVVNVITAFAQYVDQSYWLCSIAGNPKDSWKGMILGGICWFAIPFTFSTALGLGVVALQLKVTTEQADQGLVPLALAIKLLGSPGAIFVTILIFLAVTSAGSCELVGVSVITTYDIYRTYWHPEASGKQITRFSRIIIVIYGFIMAAVGILWNHIGINLNWNYRFNAVAIGPAVVPVFYSLTVARVSQWGALAGLWFGEIGSIVTWIVYAKIQSGVVSVDSLGRSYPMLAASLIGMFLSAVVPIIVSFIWKSPDFCWEEMQTQLTLVEADNQEIVRHSTTPKNLHKDRKWSTLIAISLALLLIIVWPLLTLPATVFSESYFTFWVVLAVLWGFVAAAIMTFLPLWESRDVFVEMIQTVVTERTKIFADCFGKFTPKRPLLEEELQPYDEDSNRRPDKSLDLLDIIDRKHSQNQ